MLKEALEHLKHEASAAKPVELTPIPGDGEGTMIVRFPDGSTEYVVPSPGPVVATCDTIREFLERVAAWKNPRQPAIGYGDGWARFYPDRVHPYEVVTFGSSETPEYQFLINLAKESLGTTDPSGMFLSVVEAYNLFNWLLADALGNNRKTFLDSIKHLKTIKEANQNAERARGSMTGGLESSATVVDADKLPHEAVLKIRPYTAGDLTERIDTRIRMEPDPESGRWQLYYSAEQHQQLRYKAALKVGDLVRETAEQIGAEVYSGDLKARREDIRVADWGDYHA